MITDKTQSRKPMAKQQDNKKNIKRNDNKIGDNKRNERKISDSKKNQQCDSHRKDDILQEGYFCPVYKKCGGCQLLNMSYDRQLRFKKEQVATLLKPFGKLEGIIGMEQPEFYRDKVHAAFSRDRKGNIISGTYQEKTHMLVPVEKCLLENEKADAIIQTIRGMLKSFKIKTYDEDTDYGLLRHVLIRVGEATGQIMVVLVLRSAILPSKNNFVKALLKEHPEITTVVININEKKTSMILGNREQVIYGPGYIEDRLCEMTFKISPKSFYQVNPRQTEILYQKALKFAELSGKEVVLDAYCGTGTIGMLAAPSAKHVLGVELNKDAVKDAIQNAKRNLVTNIRFYQADAGDFMVQMALNDEHVDVVLMDPPRMGSNEKFLRSVLKLSPDKIVYVSCNPETLTRDLKVLCESKYEMKRAVAVDMFPMTNHVETVCLLSKLHEEHHIEVNLNLD